MFEIKIPADQSIEEKTLEVQTAVNAYVSAQSYQLENGGPGPVADYDIMSIVNEHGGHFVVIHQGAEV